MDKAERKPILKQERASPPVAAKSQPRVQPHLLPSQHLADLKKNRAPAPMQNVNLPKPSANRKILIVDDDESMQEYLRKILEFNGFDVFETWHPQEAIDYVKKHHPVLALVDVDLGYGASGIELCKKLRDAQDGWPMKVVLISGHADEPYKIAGYSCGAVAYLPKPFGPGELVSLINRQLEEYMADRTKAPLPAVHTNGPPEKNRGIIEKAGFSVSFFESAIRYEGKPLKKELTLIEYKILLVLLKHSPNIVSNHTLLNEVWGNELPSGIKIDTTAIRAHICRLKRKLPMAARKKIYAERKDGYRIGIG